MKKTYKVLRGNTVIEVKKLTGKANKIRLRHIKNMSKGIVSFDLFPVR